MAAEKTLWALSFNTTGEVCSVGHICLFIIVVHLQGDVKQNPGSRCPWSSVHMETLQSSCLLPGGVILRNSGGCARVSSKLPLLPFLSWAFRIWSQNSSLSVCCWKSSSSLPGLSFKSPCLGCRAFITGLPATRSQPEKCLLIKPLQFLCVAFKPSWTSVSRLNATDKSARKSDLQKQTPLNYRMLSPSCVSTNTGFHFNITLVGCVGVFTEGMYLIQIVAVVWWAC